MIVLRKLLKTYDSAVAMNDTPKMVDEADMRMGAPTAYKALRIRSSAVMSLPWSVEVENGAISLQTDEVFQTFAKLYAMCAAKSTQNPMDMTIVTMEMKSSLTLQKVIRPRMPMLIETMEKETCNLVN